THVDAPECRDILDDAGAGDAFLAAVLLAKSTRSRGTWADVAVEALESVPSLLRCPGARGHLPKPPSHPDNLLPRFEGLTAEQIREHIDSSATCPFCAFAVPLKSASQQRRLRLGARYNVGVMLLPRAFHAAERTDALALCRDLLRTSAGTAYAVGTG